MSSAAQTSSSAPADSSAPGSSRTFDSGKVQNDIVGILTGAPPDGYGIAAATDPICPSGMPVVSGAIYTCAVRINSETKHVKITVLDNAGKYQVGAPQ